ncbi:hypothetical protein M3182_14935 [Mesobacillus maritimus]|uniref:hypothetical protein n=1 Tax=Mesobacillus maritimus TaxID=1643336 RepID=UPI00203B02FD|nr:hypothetical protein [Mesobacillus maritimus]MCM3587031.1 hypothetical protein [Mesobacillus maritimus]
MKKNRKNSKTGKKNQEKLVFRPILFISISAVLAILLLISIFITDMLFIKNLTQGEAPFIVFFIKDVIVIGFWGSVCLLFGLFILFGSTYAIMTKKAAKPKKLVAPAAFLAIFCFGFSYLLLGSGWVDDATEVKNYYSEGPAEQTIILQDYEVIRDYGRYAAPDEYVYTSTTGEKFRTNTDFSLDLSTNQEYEIQYLPRTKYLIGIQAD